MFKCSMKDGKMKERNQLYRHIIVESEYRSLINDICTQALLEDGSEKGNRQSTSQKENLCTMQNHEFLWFA